MRKLERLRGRVAALGEGTARRYPVKLKAELIAAAASLRDRGQSWDRVSEALGVSVETVRRWCADSEVAPREGPHGVVPVRVEPPLPTAHSRIVVVTPGGLRVEGLDVDEAAVLLRALS